MENAALSPRHASTAEAGGAPYGVRHIGIIMDGNGRWAQRRGLPRALGHRAGVEALRAIVRAVADMGVSYLTVYSFSSENWSRPAAEVAELLGLLKLFIRRDLADLNARNVRVRVVGSREGLAKDVCALLDEAENLTRHNTGLTFLVAFNYGARQEICDAVRQLSADAAAGLLDPATITPEQISARLYAADVPDPDVIIRTSGEQRLSNFLLWQAAYAEFVFAEALWPDFDRAALEVALAEYSRRTRRFGGL